MTKENLAKENYFQVYNKKISGVPKNGVIFEMINNNMTSFFGTPFTFMAITIFALFDEVR